MNPHPYTLTIIAATFLAMFFYTVPKLTPEPEIKRVSVTKKVPGPVRVKEVYRGRRRVIEPSPEQMPIGAMTQREFDSIDIGMSAEYIDAMFGNPPANVEGDGKTFFPAAGGGRYWVFWRNFDCDKHGEFCLQKVVRKAYVP